METHKTIYMMISLLGAVLFSRGLYLSCKAIAIWLVAEERERRRSRYGI
jgi:hypothetical protein